MKKLLLILIFFIFISINVSASPITISIPRESYSSKETLQAEIFLDIEPVSELTVSNFGLIDLEGNRIPVALFLNKLSSKHYFVYFNLPDLDKGVYNFEVKNFKYIEEDILKQVSELKSFQIDTINNGFKFLVENQNEDGSFNSIQETALVALALKNTYPEEAEKAINYLIENQDSIGCYPKNDCNVKDTSFSLLALNEFNKPITKTKNWLKDAQNIFDMGTWKLTLLAGDSTCDINDQEVNISNSKVLDITQQNIVINCTSSITANVVHNYLGNTYNLFQNQGKHIEINIDDSGCFGEIYRSNCSYEDTGYATYALQKVNEQVPTTWLGENPSDIITLDHALLYLIKNNQYSFGWLLNNIQNNAWASTSASRSEIIDIYSSIFATFALKNSEVYENAKSFLAEKTTEDNLNSALVLYFLFSDERIKPSISISPGIVNQKTSFDLKIKNHQNPVNISITAPTFTNLPSSLLLEDEETFNIIIPENASNFNIELSYDDKSYLIPVLVKQPLLEENEIIEITEILLPPPRDSIEILDITDQINKTLSKEDILQDSLLFKNKWNFPLHNITFYLTGNLDKIVKLNTTNFPIIKENETLKQYMWINSEQKPEFRTYNGLLVITSNERTLTSLPLTFQLLGETEELTEQVEQQIFERENQTVEIEETEEVEEEIEEEGEEKSYWWIWLIIIILLVIAIILFFVFKRKITEPKIETFGEYIEEIGKR